MRQTLQLLCPRLRKAAAQLPYLHRTLALVWQASGGWTTAWASLLVIQGLLPVATVYLTRAVVDRMVVVFRTQGDPEALRAAAWPALGMALVWLLSEGLRAVAGYIRTAQADLVQDHITALIHRQSVQADLAFYESPEFYDHLHRARAEAAYRPVALLETLGGLFQNGLTLIAMAAVLSAFSPWIPVLLLLCTLPALLVVLRYAVEQHQWRRRVTPHERRTWYYDWLLTSSDTAAELRLFGLGEHFHNLYQALRARLRRERLDLALRQSLAELGAGAAALVLSAGALIWMAWRAVRGLVSLGDLALFYQAFQQGLRLMRAMLENVGQLYSNILFLGNLYEFLALRPQVVSPPEALPVPRPLRDGVRFCDVSFCYPGSERPALDGFNLTVPAGTIAAVVGPNGAGKTTLLKLLCRFYDPQSGIIRIDGTDLRSFSLEDLRRNLTVLFQQPVRYSATARENIVLGDSASAPSEPSIRQAAQAAGAEESILRLPHGYDTLLGKWFEEGAELSTGEWQRLALARAFLRPAPLIILDEPTSSMDPWAEADWLERFRRLAQGRTALIITHRFTTAKLADVIHVMEAGRICESGTHRELVARGGRYASWWAAQRIA
ncbi:MAG: ABC transporter ATP-binding protein/permease [Bryobacteraceae bacterium]|nr:ABC transporter ATP-binding protein/permease [Bryobacteraceae bacterium]